MTDVRDMTDSELLAHYALPSLIEQESGGRVGVLGPQTRYGRAQGMTQMLPDTARSMAQKIGVDWRPELMTGTSEEAADYQRALGLAYLQQGIEETGNLEDGFRYYHGGPNRKLWGDKTNAYAQQVGARLTSAPAPAQGADLSGMSDDELLALYQGQEPQGNGVEVSLVDHPEIAPVQAAKRPAQIPQKMRSDEVLGFTKGVVDPLANTSRRLAQIDSANYLPPALQAILAPARMFTPQGIATGLLGYAKGAVDNDVQAAAARGVKPGAMGEFAGNVAVSAPMPGGPLVSGLLSGAMLSKNENPASILLDAGLGAAGGAVGGAIAKGGSKLLGAVFSKAPEVRSPAALEEAKNAAYQAAENAGVKYKASTFNGLVSAIHADMKAANYNSQLHPNVMGALRQLSSMRGRTPTLTEVDQLRQFIRENVIDGSKKGEQRLGQMMIKEIDNFLAVAGPKQVISGDPKAAAAAIKEARDLNTRLMKTKDVEKGLDEAGLRAGSTGSGGNVDNATRQNLLRVLKKAHGLTKDETEALRKVIMGTTPQNILRQIGKLSPQGNGLMTALGIGGTMANPIFGVPALVGAVSKVAADKMTKANVDELLRIIAAGGNAQAVKKVVSPAVKVAQKNVERLQAPAAAAGAALAVGAGSTAPKRSAKP